MNAKALVLLLVWPACGFAQGFAGLESGAEGYAAVTRPASLAFPRDHGPHPDFRIEWWYVTAALQGADGADYGVQWTLFRQALAQHGPAAGWETPEVWMGHAAASSASTHRTAETFARGGIGQAEVQAAPFHAWIDGWSLKAPDGAAAGDAIADLRVTAAGDGFAYDLDLSTDRPPVPQGDDGFSVKSERGQASYYYSQPFYAVTGTLTLDGRDVAVTGQAWLDREWSSQPLDNRQSGWDWFALHLASGDKVMLYRLREGDGAYLAGTWIDADGHPTPLAPDQIETTATRFAEVAGRRLPVGWHLAIPSHGLAVDTTPLNAQSWMGTTYAYWEGPIRVTGSHAGTGYMELTGY